MATKTYAQTGRGDRKRTELGLFAQMYFDIERLRVSQQIRQSHLKLDKSPFANHVIFDEVFGDLKDAQSVIDVYMIPLVKPHPCWTEFNINVKGCGLHLLGLIMGLIRDVTPLTNVSKLWWLCGLGVTSEGKAARPVKGEVLNYDARLKMVLLGRLGAQFLKNNDPFARRLYDDFKVEEVAKALAAGRVTDVMCVSCFGKDERCVTCGGTGKTQVEVGSHKRAIRKVVKLWVACLWDVWRRAEGLPVTEHYAQSHMGHTGNLITPQRWVEYNLSVNGTE